MKGTVTVAIPCRDPNPGHFREALRSLKRSTWRGFEVVVVDDGSQDHAFEVVLAAELPEARLVRHPRNLGLPTARNTAVEASTSEFVLQLDADDQVAPTFLEKALWALESHPEWSFCGAWTQVFGSKDFVWARGFENGREFLDDNSTTATCLIRREADRAIGGHDPALTSGLEDWDYWLRMAENGLWGGSIQEPLVRYRVGEAATSWPERDDPVRNAKFRKALRERYAELWTRRGWVRFAERSESDFPEAIPEFGGGGRATEASAPAGGDGNVRGVLLVTGSLGLGGVDRFALDVVRHLVKQGVGVSVVATDAGDHPWQALFERETDDVFVLSRFLRARDYPRFLRAMAESRGVDAVFVNASLAGYAFLPYLRSHLPGKTFVDYVHFVDRFWRNGGFARASVNAASLLHGTLCSSESAREWLEKERGATPPTVASPIGVDTVVWDPKRFDRQEERERLGLETGQPVILFAGRLQAQKRPRFFLAILRALARRGLEFTCVVAGDGPEEAWFRRAGARGALAGRVKMLGAVEPDEMPRVYAASDVLLLPSRDEGIALVVFESMAMGVVPVVAAVGGQAEAVTPETGVVLPAGTDGIEAWVEAVARLLSNADLRRRMAKAARERVETRFRAKVCQEHVVEFLKASSARARRAEDVPPYGESARNATRAAISAFEADHLPGSLIEGRASSNPLVRAGRFVKLRLFRPVYLWGLRQGFEWLVPLKVRIRKSMSRGKS